MLVFSLFFTLYNFMLKFGGDNPIIFVVEVCKTRLNRRWIQSAPKLTNSMVIVTRFV